MKISVYIATSLDGFIARENGDIDWLTGASIPDDPEDYGYMDFIYSVDCIVMGRNTLTRIPVLLGSGLPLFGALPKELKVTHVETQSFPSGFVQSKYRV